MYVTSSTFTIGVDPSAKGITLMCMSCHDGITTIQNIINVPGGGTATAFDDTLDQIGDLPYDIILGGGGPNIGNLYGPSFAGNVNLSDDHPVSFTWVAGLPGIKEPATWPPNTVKLFTLGGNARMECATCHDPHDTTYPPFLRMSNANSGMCLTCHDK